MKFGLKNKKRIIAVLISVIFMGLTVSFLIRINFGTDPCSTLNLGVANRLGISFGTWQAIFQGILLMFVFLFDRSEIGWGTLANMFLVGYSSDFFTWLFDQIIPTDILSDLTVRIIVLVPALTIFIISAAFYMAVDLGTAPYDAVVFIIASKIKKVPFRIIRVLWDVTAAAIGFMFGSTLGIVTIVMAFALGPAITAVKNKIDRFI
mgnify:CR=1 FL=1